MTQSFQHYSQRQYKVKVTIIFLFIRQFEKMLAYVKFWLKNVVQNVSTMRDDTCFLSQNR